MLAEDPGHHHAKLLLRSGARDAIRGREQVALERGSIGREVAYELWIAGGAQEAGGLEKIEASEIGGDVEHVAALGHDEFIEEDVAAHDSAENVAGRVGARE